MRELGVVRGGWGGVKGSRGAGGGAEDSYGSIREVGGWVVGGAQMAVARDPVKSGSHFE